MSKLETIEAELKLDAEEALDTTKELVDLMDELSPMVVIRGAKNCTFNIYPSQRGYRAGAATKGEEDG